MTSLPKEFVGSLTSLSTSLGVKDAIESYRRSQCFMSSSNVPSDSDLSEPVVDEEACILPPNVGEDENGASPSATPGEDDGLVHNLQWDEDDLPTPRPISNTEETYGSVVPPSRLSKKWTTERRASYTRSEAREDTPLLRKTAPLSGRPESSDVPAGALPSVKQPSDALEVNVARPNTLLRHPSAVTIKSVKHNFGGRSTFGQTLFNSIAILLGIGMLSEPLAFAYAGWIGGTFLIVFYGCITCYTAKILAHIILGDPRLRSYADIGRKAFGPRSMPLTSAMFCLELFAVSVALVTLYADSLHSIIPDYSADLYKLLGLIVLIPTIFMPLSLLSYTSILGIVSTLFLIAVIAIDGLSKKDCPGSLWSPAHTTIGVQNFGELGVAFGLFMAGFSGHAVIPSLARDMIDPSQFNVMIDWAFTIATLIYAVIGIAGYLMFGRSVHDEISQDLLLTPGYNPTLNKIALWMLVINPLSKFALATRPLTLTLENILGLDTAPHASLEDHGVSSKDAYSPTAANKRNPTLKRIFTVLERIAFACLSVSVSILVPEFSAVMAFLGSFSAFLLCVVGPVAAKIALRRRCEVWDGALLVTAIAMAIWGTGAAFVSVE